MIPERTPESKMIPASAAMAMASVGDRDRRFRVRSRLSQTRAISLPITLTSRLTKFIGAHATPLALFININRWLYCTIDSYERKESFGCTAVTLYFVWTGSY